ncbi:hypothetical protein [Cesiribacter sp. SM1]|uniref:hypothetical protein n=1 Tax=Cesiribacter sp. SM1 TaxID=2861196 RepID=UPI001CD707E8|nr:hypothetical protein [Cesiribacter sp. SM1]
MKNTDNNKAEDLIQRLKQLNEFLKASIKRINHEVVDMENELKQAKTTYLRKPVVCKELLLGINFSLN